MNQPFITSPNTEKAILVGVITPQQPELMVKEFLAELDFLAETAGVESVKHFTQKLEFANPRTYLGQGKLNEIKQFITEKNIDIAIFDDELSPSQLRNLEQFFNVKILDRTNLILDIFAHRAQTAHARVQVELAQYQYLLPRLTRRWTHLERQKGGIGLRGPGETELETDRRFIRDRIAHLKKQLETIDRQKETQRQNRGKMVKIALVGYTNVGKSTLMNLLSKSNVFAENKLFATLDTTVRKMVIENLPVLISDTVGFIRKLPTHLIESFKSTLDEIREADILLHIVDISHPNFEEQIKIVNQTLRDIGSGDKTMLMVFNKTDAYTFSEKEETDLTPKTKENLSPDDLKKSWMARDNTPCVFISAKYKINIVALKQMIYDMAKAIHVKRFPYNDLLYPDISDSGNV